MRKIWKKSIKNIINPEELPVITMIVFIVALMIISLCINIGYIRNKATGEDVHITVNNTTTPMITTKETIPITTTSDVSRATSSTATTATTDNTTIMTTTTESTTKTDETSSSTTPEVVETSITIETTKVEETQPIETTPEEPITEPAITEPISSETSSSETSETEIEIPVEPVPDETEPVNTRPVIYDCTLSDDLQQYIYNKCMEYSVEYEYIMAIIKTESGFNTNAYNGNCVGLMQLNAYYNSGTAYALGVDLYEPYGNVTVGIHHVADLLSRYSMSDALICYNYGEYGAQGYLGGSTSYSRTVMSRYYEYVES